MEGSEHGSPDAGREGAARVKRRRELRIRGAAYPVLLPSWRDPRLHLAATFVCLHTIGQVEFHFKLSIPQIVTALLTVAVIEVAVTFRRERAIIWPASALLTGNGIAFILRVPGTEHGDWWSFRGVWIYAAVGAVSLLAKYLIRFRGRHIFNPSNLGLVLFFLILGSTRTEPLQFWWGPMTPALVVVLGTIVAGALLILSRLHLLAVAALFWTTFAASLGVLALSGHAFSANWHLGPVADGYFWRVLITSPEVFIFLSFMITDPRTVPETRVGRRVYAVSIGLLGALLIAPQQTEFAAKVGLLGSLTIVCAARPLLILLRERLAARPPRAAERARGLAAEVARRRPVLGTVAAGTAAAFAAVLVAAGSPARSVAGISAAAAPVGAGIRVSITPTPGLVAIDRRTGNRIARDAVDDLRLAAHALSTRDAAVASQCAGGSFLADLRSRITRAGGGEIVVPSYQVSDVRLKLRPAVGQAPPTVVATLSGMMTELTYAPGRDAGPVRGAPVAFQRTFDLAFTRDRFLIVDGSGHRPGVRSTVPAAVPAAGRPHGVGSFRSVRLTDVAPRIGLTFRQGAFRYGVTPDPAAMMGGGLCWLDYDNDGWLDLFVVNSYGEGDIGAYSARGGLPRSSLFHNVHGRFVNVSSGSGAGRTTRGEGCVAADLNGDGYTDLVVTTAQDDELLWNNGNGTFTEGARSHGVVSYGWHSSAAVADVDGDGRQDLFIAGYTNPNAPIPGSMAGFPTNHLGIRDLLFLNEGNGPDGRARFREVGVRAGLDRAPYDHSLGVTFTDVNGDGRPDLYVANDEDPNRLYLNERGGPLGFHFVDAARRYRVDDPNAGMGVAEGDYNGDGLPDLFITNSRGQAHAAYESALAPGAAPAFTPEMTMFANALQRRATVGWGDAFVDLDNDGNLDLVIANGAIPVTNMKKDAQPMQVLQGGRRGRFVNASGAISPDGMPKIIGRGLAVADFDNDGRMDVAVNSIGGPLVVLANTGATGHWLEVSLSVFRPGAVITATLPDGRRLVRELHAGGSYLSSQDPRAHFGLGRATSVRRLVIRYPDGREETLVNVRANRIVRVGTGPVSTGPPATRRS